MHRTNNLPSKLKYTPLHFNESIINFHHFAQTEICLQWEYALLCESTFILSRRFRSGDHFILVLACALAKTYRFTLSSTATKVTVIAIMKVTSRIYLITLSIAPNRILYIFGRRFDATLLSQNDRPETKLTNGSHSQWVHVCVFCMSKGAALVPATHDKLKFNYKSSNYFTINHNQLRYLF